MFRTTAVALFFTLACGAVPLAPVAMAAEGSVTITFPKEGQKLDIMEQNKIVYAVVPGPRGDHVHAYVDGKEVAVLRQMKGSYTLEALSAGKHALCIKVVNKAHVPIGVQNCVNVEVD